MKIYNLNNQKIYSKQETITFNTMEGGNNGDKNEFTKKRESDEDIK